METKSLFSDQTLWETKLAVSAEISMERNKPIWRAQRTAHSALEPSLLPAMLSKAKTPKKNATLKLQLKDKSNVKNKSATNLDSNLADVSNQSSEENHHHHHQAAAQAHLNQTSHKRDNNVNPENSVNQASQEKTEDDHKKNCQAHQAHQLLNLQKANNLTVLKDNKDVTETNWTDQENQAAHHPAAAAHPNLVKTNLENVWKKCNSSLKTHGQAEKSVSQWRECHSAKPPQDADQLRPKTKRSNFCVFHAALKPDVLLKRSKMVNLST